MDSLQLLKVFIILVVQLAFDIEGKKMILSFLGNGCLKGKIGRNGENGMGRASVDLLKQVESLSGIIAVAV